MLLFKHYFSKTSYPPPNQYCIIKLGSVGQVLGERIFVTDEQLKVNMSKITQNLKHLTGFYILHFPWEMFSIFSTFPWEKVFYFSLGNNTFIKLGKKISSLNIMLAAGFSIIQFYLITKMLLITHGIDL